MLLRRINPGLDDFNPVGIDPTEPSAHLARSRAVDRRSKHMHRPKEHASNTNLLAYTNTPRILKGFHQSAQGRRDEGAPTLGMPPKTGHPERVEANDGAPSNSI